jgi:NAD(P)-dependent dehydrogenase (short-subunit alcohol dehydrogenase family)
MASGGAGSSASKPSGWAEQVAVISGGAQGIGYGIAEHLSSLGVAVCLVDMDKDKVAEAAAKLTAAGRKASSAVVNVADEGQWKAALSSFNEKYGRLDILVQAAGITGKTGINTHDVDPSNFDLVMNVNARGIFLGCRTILPYFISRNYGRIINIASVAGKDGNAGMVAYSASKGAVIAMTKSIGKEYAESGITCNALAPAVVRTAMVDAMPEAQVKYMTGAFVHPPPPPRTLSRAPR